MSFKIGDTVFVEKYNKIYEGTITDFDGFKYEVTPKQAPYRTLVAKKVFLTRDKCLSDFKKRLEDATDKILAKLA